MGAELAIEASGAERSPSAPGRSGAGWWFSEFPVETPAKVPFYSFILKVASICNLDCSYCYVYNMADQRWKVQPKFMSQEVLNVTLDRIHEHLVSHGADSALVIFHGGEPLLLGPSGLDEMAAQVRERLADIPGLRLGLQTNGTLIDDAFVRVFQRHSIRAGLSVDGPPEGNDIYRVTRTGRGTGRRVERALRILRENPEVFGGILSVVNVDRDPASTYRYLKRWNPGMIDFLLPHATFETRPWTPENATYFRQMGTWMSALFDCWYDDRGVAPRVRYFESIMRTLLGSKTLVESIGLGGRDLVVVETNGEVEAVDTLKACYPGASATGLSIRSSSFDDAQLAPQIMARAMGMAGLAKTCQECRMVSVCGGGYQPHRYSSRNGFLNPSVYCDSLQLLIAHVAHRVRDDLVQAGIEVPLLLERLAT